MKTTRDIMRDSSENMGWCKPYISDRVAFTVAGDKIEALRIDGEDVPATEDNLFRAAVIVNPDAGSYRGWSIAHILTDGDVTETSCASCPWFDICEAMDQVIEGTETTGDLIRSRRIASGMTQVQLAELIGCTQKDVSRWENGEREPGVSSLKKLAAALGCKIDDLA